MSIIVSKQNLWINGITGERITAIRESQIYQSSSRDIVGFNISELGNLRAMTDYDRTANPYEDIVDILETRFGYYIIVTLTAIYTADNNSHAIKHTLPISLPGLTTTSNTSTVSNTLFIVINGKVHSFEINKDTGEIKHSDFFKDMEMPLVDRENVTIDIYRKFEETVDDQTVKELRIVYTSSDPEIGITPEGKIKISGRKQPLDRLYVDFKAALTSDSVEEVTKDHYIGVFRNFRIADERRKFYIGNTPIVFTGRTLDEVYGGDYFTGIKVEGSPEGEFGEADGKLLFGELVDFIDSTIDVGQLQSRTYVIAGSKIYFSKEFEYINFRNGPADDDPFFIKPTPINNVEPVLLRGRTGKGLYIMSDRGIYVIGFSKVLTPSTVLVDVASDTEATREAELVDDTFFFISASGKLKAMQSATNKVNDKFFTVAVEKYDILDEFNHITTGYIGGKKKLIAQKKRIKVKNPDSPEYQKVPDKNLYVYETKGTNEFRKVKYDTLEDNYRNKKVYFIYKDMIMEGLTCRSNNKFTRYCKIKMLPPVLETERGGTILNDSTSRIVKVSVKTLNSYAGGIKQLKINGINVSKIGSNQEDLFSIYTIKCSFPVNNGFDIEIETNQNEDHVEILGVETFVEVAGI